MIKKKQQPHTHLGRLNQAVVFPAERCGSVTAVGSSRPKSNDPPPSKKRKKYENGERKKFTLKSISTSDYYIILHLLPV